MRRRRPACRRHNIRSDLYPARRFAPATDCRSSIHRDKRYPEITAERRRFGKKLRAAHVGAGASVDLDRLALFDEERDVDRFAGFELGRLGHVAGGIAT
jgi:hypothetical protein